MSRIKSGASNTTLTIANGLRTSFLLLATVLVLGACSTMNKTQKGVAIGSASGAVVGGVVGKIAGNTALGAIIGATAGGVTGGLIGRKMDKQAEELAKEIKDAEIKREGEGIIINFKDNVMFAYDRSDLNASAKTNLDKLAVILQKYPETNITVIGHTDSKGTTAYNQSLSERRANAVTSYAVNHGISNSRLIAIGKGETDPIATNTTTEGSMLNRRVEFVITANEAMKAEAKEQAGK